MLNALDLDQPRVITMLPSFPQWKALQPCLASGEQRAKPDSWTEPPGGILVWIIVFVEMLTFGMGLVVFLVQARENADMFQAGRMSLSQPIGMVNTMVLLTGGWFMTKVITHLRKGRECLARRWLLATIFSGTSGGNEHGPLTTDSLITEFLCALRDLVVKNPVARVPPSLTVTDVPGQPLTHVPGSYPVCWSHRRTSARFLTLKK